LASSTLGPPQGEVKGLPRDEGKSDVISIQSIMLVALGFLAAALLALVVAPAFWNRAVRLTTRRLKEQLPLTEAEIRADKDRLRAEYAIRVHRLETKAEQADLQRARQLIEINRRDGVISQLEQDQVRLLSVVDENVNARHVLEQTVADRLPKVEARLNEAKTILFNRDREIAELTQSTSRQNLALEEARSINSQQNSELERLTNALTVRGARNQQALVDPSFEGELALRAEIEALRSKTREQAGLIGRLQAQSGRGALLSLGEAGPAPSLNTPLSNGHGLNGHGSDRAQDRLAGTALTVVASSGVDDPRAGAERDLRSLKAKLDDQANEIARLSAELQVFKAGADGEGSGLKDSKIALKARLNAAQAQAEQSSDSVKRLRAELAASNERLALQGAHFMEQMRRLGAGTLPAAGQTRRPVTQGSKLTLAERVAQSRTATPTTQAASAQTPTGQTSASQSRVGSATPAAVETVSPSASSKVAATPLTSAPEPEALTPQAQAAGESHPVGDIAVASLSHTAASAAETAVVADPPARKQRLIDRISSINKS
jgi:hypothetical protein